MHKKHDDDKTTHRKVDPSVDDPKTDVATLERRPTSDKIQPYDAAKGFDETQYDMKKGEIGNPAVPNPHEPEIAPLPANQSTGLCVECGKGVAPGQNYVCRDHQRFN